MSKTHQNLPRTFMSKYGNQELRIKNSDLGWKRPGLW